MRCWQGVQPRFTRLARLPRDVPEKAEGFPFGIPPAHSELRPFVARHRDFSRSTRKSLSFFRPITQRLDGWRVVLLIIQ
jgi:hypothetical protein